MLLQKKQQNVCYNVFESLYSFAHFKCKGYILYSKLLLQWAVKKKKFWSSAKIKKIISRNFQVSHWKKKYVSITVESRLFQVSFISSFTSYLSQVSRSPPRSTISLSRDADNQWYKTRGFRDFEIGLKIYMPRNARICRKFPSNLT